MEDDPFVATSNEIKGWRYNSSKARMVIEKASSDSSPQPQLARLELTSLFNGNSHSSIHRARYEFEFHSDEANFSVQLPKHAKLIEILVNGIPQTTKKPKAGFIHLPLPDQPKNSIEIRYETEWDPQGLVFDQTVPLPQSDVEILEFRWRLGLSPNWQLTELSSGLSFLTAPKSPHWTMRFFGPLGRGSKTEPFRPWYGSSWKTLFHPGTKNEVQQANPIPSDFLPADWLVYEARAPRIGETLTLKGWNSSLSLRWAWIALLTSMIIGFGLRMKAWPYRRQLGLFWVLLNFTIAGLFPMPWAMIAGGNLTGTLLAVLFPRRILRWQPTSSNNIARPGSTVSFEHPPVISLFISGGIWIMVVATLGFLPSALGQQILPKQVPASRNEESVPTEIDVLIPVTDSQTLQLDTSVVYVDRDFLEKIQGAQAPYRPTVSHLISSAKYHARVIQNSVEMTATFDVAVLNPQQRVKVRLPIDEVFPGGPEHCLVDGQPHALFLDPDKKGFLIELTPQTSRAPAVAERPGRRVPVQFRPQTRQIVLRLHGKVTSSPNGGRFSFAAPAVASSEFQIQFPENYGSIGVRGLPGQLQRTTESKSLIANIGATKTVDVFWSHDATHLPPKNQQPPRVFALATIYPLRIEWQIRVSSVPKSVSASRKWTLPANTVVQELNSTHPVSYEFTSSKTATEILFEFQDPVPAELTVDIACMTPRGHSSPPTDLEIPEL
ncbi:MAG: hypothetical protein KDA84_25640, partial [Planctomycetaceae bacterium]|nr:hypothetical protein [Planctomycetaceae bacterium]